MSRWSRTSGSARTGMKPTKTNVATWIVAEARFVTLGGESFTTSELRGKVTVVNFWATWCPDCVREMPRMIEAHRKFAPRGYEMIAVAVRDHPNRVADYARKEGLPF